MRKAGESPPPSLQAPGKSGGTWESQILSPSYLRGEDRPSESSEKYLGGEELTGHTWKGDLFLREVSLPSAQKLITWGFIQDRGIQGDLRSQTKKDP